MNSRISAIVALLTTITLLTIKLAVSTEFSFAEFIWQDILAVLVILFLAKEIGAVDIKEEQPILITVNNDVTKTKFSDMNFDTFDETNANANISTKMVDLLDVLANKINHIEKKLEYKPEFATQQNNFNVQKSCIPEDTQIFQTERIYKTKNKHRETFHHKQILAMAADASGNPSIKSPKVSMLQSIFKENEELQKKAS